MLYATKTRGAIFPLRNTVDFITVVLGSISRKIFHFLLIYSKFLGQRKVLAADSFFVAMQPSRGHLVLRTRNVHRKHEKPLLFIYEFIRMHFQITLCTPSLQTLLEHSINYQDSNLYKQQSTFCMTLDCIKFPLLNSDGQMAFPSSILQIFPSFFFFLINRDGG